jgi:predicted ATPase/DNA-binding SARP family transcriptional activator
VTTELVLLSRVAFRGQEITRPRLRGLLALLAGELRAGLGATGLVDGLWGDRRPENPTKALRVLVSQARAALGADLIVSTPGGYRLALREDQVDAAALVLAASASARHARAGDHSAALEHARAGLALWAGPAGDLETGDPLGDLRAARAATHRSLVRSRALALARLGRHAESLDALTGLLDDHPRDEEVLAELLRAEAATTGPAAALTRYDTYRRTLREQLGADPGPALRQLHQRLLTQDRPPVRLGVAHEPNPLLGRDEDIVALTDLLGTSRVTSIVGAGGLGKTRLAHAVARAARQRAVYFVPLAGLPAGGDLDQVIGQVATVLGVGEQGPGSVGRAVPTDALAGVVRAIGSGQALLVLDNCEHVVAGAAALVRTLVSMCGELRVLTTSRAPLGLSSEAVYPLPELRLATVVELFGQRALAARPGVDLPVDAVRELCAQLDGLPLAVELAAARVRVMSVGEIARGLDDRFALLRGGPRDAPARHRTLRAVIDWSWTLLEPSGQAAMRALSVFPAGFTADAATAVLDIEALPVLEQLVDQSLLKVVDTGAGTRFQMLETVREFSAAHRDQAGETAGVTDRFLLWATDFGIANHGSVFAGDPVPAMDRLRVEQDNLWHALRLGLDRADGAVVAATSGVLGTLWTVESNVARMSGPVEETGRVLARYRPEPELVEVTRTAAVLATVTTFLLEGPRATRSLVALLRLPPPDPADTLLSATDIVLRTVARGRRSELEALCDNGSPLVAGIASNVVSYAREHEGDLDRALSSARAMVAAGQRAADPWILALAYSRLGELCLQADLGEEARGHLLAALELVEGFGAWSSAARVRWALVLANLQSGMVDEAERWLERAMCCGDDPSGLGMFDVAVRAEIHLARGEVDAGLDLWRRTADSVRESADSSWALEVRAVTVVAHAQHGRLDLVAELVEELPRTLSERLTCHEEASAMSYVDYPVCGGLLLALAMVDLDLAERTGDRGKAASVARVIALVERFRWVRGFQPTMSSANARRLAERVDRPAYEDAVSSYADLGVDALRVAALAALREREAVQRSRLNIARAHR